MVRKIHRENDRTSEDPSLSGNWAQCNYAVPHKNKNKQPRIWRRLIGRTLCLSGELPVATFSDGPPPPLEHPHQLRRAHVPLHPPVTGGRSLLILESHGVLDGGVM